MAGYPYYQNPYQVGYANFQPYQGYQAPPVQQQPEFRYYPVNGEEGANNFLVAAGISAAWNIILERLKGGFDDV